MTAGKSTSSWDERAPNFGALRAAWNTSADLTKVFVGIHPVFIQVPPS